MRKETDQSRQSSVIQRKSQLIRILFMVDFGFLANDSKDMTIKLSSYISKSEN